MSNRILSTEELKVELGYYKAVYVVLADTIQKTALLESFADSLVIEHSDDFEDEIERQRWNVGEIHYACKRLHLTIELQIARLNAELGEQNA